jgi:hypothetical protein
MRACVLFIYRFVAADCGHMPILIVSEALGNRRVFNESFAGLDLAVYDQSLFNDFVCSCCACCFEDERPIALLGINSMLSPCDLHDLQFRMKALVRLVELRNCRFLIVGINAFDPYSVYEYGERLPPNNRCARD